MDNRRIAQILGEIGDLLDIKGENPFRIRSYRLAADSVVNHGADVADLVRNGADLKDLPGVGSGIAEKIRDMVATGDTPYHQELLNEVPAGLLELLELPGLGPKGVSLVWRKLGVTGPEALEEAIADGRFRTLPGMKEKKEARLLKGLEERRHKKTRFTRAFARDAIEDLKARLLTAGATAVEAAGSWRRGRESVGDLDLIALGGRPDALGAALASHPEAKEVLGRGEAKTTVVLSSGIQIDLRCFEGESLGSALQYFTGSKAHNVALRERAVRLGFKLNEYGIYDSEDRRLGGATEQEIYKVLGLPFIPPELREDRGEIQAALEGTLPKLVEPGDLKGDLHSHTTESDGRESLESMAASARASGLQYLAVTDHSRAIPSPTKGTGMDETRCLAHMRRVREYSKKAGIRLLAGIEVDILPDGGLDMDDSVLAELDVVVASLHSRLNMERGEMTDRVLKAFENPHFHIWGHPLARVLFKRDPVAIDLERVLDAAAQRGIALEINGQPDRLDLPDAFVPQARARGIRFVISSDSHSSKQLENRFFAVSQARRGWLRSEDVLNTLPVDSFLKSLRKAPGNSQGA